MNIIYKNVLPGGQPGAAAISDLTKGIHKDKKSPGGVRNEKHSGL
jgi:hypothetical protein